MKKYKLKIVRKDHPDRTVTVRANSTTDAIDLVDPPDDCTDIDVMSVEEEKGEDGKDDKKDSDAKDKDSGGKSDSKESGDKDGGKEDGDKGGIVEDDGGKPEPVEDDGNGAGKEEGKTDDSDEVEPEDSHFWFKNRGKKN